jgi:major membrane immunogen (membrane-anchored lipoprotein)
MNKSFLAVAGLAVLAVSQTAVAEGFRCGQKIATPDMTVEELLEACGEPTDKTMEVVDVHGPNAQGAGNIKRGTITVETWTYDRGSQASAMVVTIEDGKIKKMERAESK